MSTEHLLREFYNQMYRVHTQPVHTRSDEECDRVLHAYRLDGVHRGYIGGMLLEKFYNRGWVDYVLLVLTLHRAASR